MEQELQKEPKRSFYALEQLRQTAEGILRGSQRLRPLIDRHDRSGKKSQHNIKQGRSLLLYIWKYYSISGGSLQTSAFADRKEARPAEGRKA